MFWGEIGKYRLGSIGKYRYFLVDKSTLSRALVMSEHKSCLPCKGGGKFTK